MPLGTRTRDQNKSLPNRIGEVLSNLARRAGQANSQTKVFGCAVGVGSTNTQFSVSAGQVVLGQALQTVAIVASQALPAGAATSAGQFCKVLIEIDAGGTVTATAGALAASQAAAALPNLTATRMPLGWIEIPASFTVGTTVVTAGMCKQMVDNSGATAGW